MHTELIASLKKPKVQLPTGPNARRIGETLRRSGLTTICQEGRCPNIGKCWAELHATFMLLGDVCTRHCRFCSVRSGRPKPLSEEDWRKLEVLADSVAEMGLRYVVLTMVDRDDLPDGGARYLAKAVSLIRERSPRTYVELLIGDLGGVKDNLRALLDEGAPDVLGHNVETVRRITPLVRDRRASYEQSLKVLEWALELSGGKLMTKSGLILGMGETFDEVLETMRDLRSVGVLAITIGQYYPPSKNHYPLKKVYSPEEFSELERIAKEMGFLFAKAGYRVRSSYEAGEIVAILRRRGLSPGYLGGKR